MFGHTFFATDMSNSTKPKVPSAAGTSAAIRRTSPSSRPSTKSNVASPLNPHLRSVQKQTTSRMPSRDTDISNRYTNSSFSRLPSPPGVVIRTGSASKGTRNAFAVKLNKDKEDSSKTKFQAVKERRSEIIKRPMQTQCTTTRPRPKTAMTKRTADKSVQESPSFQNNVLLKVKDALENLMMDKGSIDISDLDRVMTYVKTHMNDKESVCDNGDDRKKIEVESKCSRMIVNIPSPSSIVSSPRREMKSHSIGNRRIYGQTETPLMKNESSFNVLSDEDRTSGNADKGEDRHFEFQDIQNQNENKKSLSSQLSNELKKYFASKGPQEADRVGDSQANDGKAIDIWRAVEEIDLRSYIKSLVNDMNQELQAEKCLMGLFNHAKSSNKVSKIVSVSKICTSDTISSKSPDSIPNRDNTSKISCKTSSTGVKTSRNTLKIAESRCKVLKRNSRIQHESKLLPKTQPATPEIETRSESVNYKFSEPTTTSESKEDLYLQRRRKLAGTKKDVKVLHYGQ